MRGAEAQTFSERQPDTCKNINTDDKEKTCINEWRNIATADPDTGYAGVPEWLMRIKESFTSESLPDLIATEHKNKLAISTILTPSSLK